MSEHNKTTKRVAVRGTTEEDPELRRLFEDPVESRALEFDDK